eukprot:1030660-Pleurochrysis_carterae.AAC.1
MCGFDDGEVRAVGREELRAGLELGVIATVGKDVGGLRANIPCGVRALRFTTMREGGSKTAKLMSVLLGNPDETFAELDVQLYAEHHLNKMADLDYGGGDRVRSSKRHKPRTDA